MDKNNNPNMQHITMHKPKKPWYKRFWVWFGILVLLGIISSALAPKSTPATTNSDTPTPAASTETPAAKWDVQAAYDKITIGMTKAQVEEATGKPSDSCTESDMGQLGKSESCSYGNAFIDKSSIFVTYSNGEMSTKTKSTY
jgi:hypothetical protein